MEPPGVRTAEAAMLPHHKQALHSMKRLDGPAARRSRINSKRTLQAGDNNIHVLIQMHGLIDVAVRC